MAFRTWGRLLLTALGVSVLAGAGQLGVAYGFGIIRLTGAFTGTTVNQWPAQLVWVGWFAANAAVAGAVLTGRLARRDGLPATIGRQLALGGAAALGATAVAPLCMQPARAAELISVDPVWAVGICAILGAIIGAGAAIAVLLRPELGWNVAAVAGAVWLLALVSVLPSLGTTGPLPTVRLGVLEPSWLDAATAQRLALLLLPTVALLAGAATAGLARRRGEAPLVSGATGVAGPVLVAFAYLTAGPGDAVDRYQTTPYYAALLAVAAGALGAAAAALLRWPARTRTAAPDAIEPSDILRPLPTGPALPSAAASGSATPTDERDTAEPAGAELAGSGSTGAGLRTADGTGAVRTVPAHWDWPATTAGGQHGSVPHRADPPRHLDTPAPRVTGRPRHRDDVSTAPSETTATGLPVTDSPFTDSSVMDSPATGSPVAGSPVTSSPLAGGPGTGSPGTREPVARSPITPEPVTGEPVAGTPVAGRSVAGRPGRRPGDDGPAASAAWLTDPTGEFAAARLDPTPAAPNRDDNPPTSPTADPNLAVTPTASERPVPVTAATASTEPGSASTARPATAPTRATHVPASDMTDRGDSTRAATTDATGPDDHARAATTNATGFGDQARAAATAGSGPDDAGSAQPGGPAGGSGDDGPTGSAATTTSGTPQPAGDDLTSAAATATSGTPQPAGSGSASAPAPKPRRTRKPKSTPTAAATAPDPAAGTPSADSAPGSAGSVDGDDTGSTQTGRPGSTAKAAARAGARASTPPAPSDASTAAASDPAAAPATGTSAGRARKTARAGKDSRGSRSGRGTEVAATTPAVAATDPAPEPAAVVEPATEGAATDAAAAAGTGTDRGPDTRARGTERSRADAGAAGQLFGMAASGDPEADRWTLAPPAWPVNPTWAATPRAGELEPGASDAPTGPEEPTELAPRPRHRAPLPDLSRAATWDAFTTARRASPGSADPQDDPTTTTWTPSSDSPATHEPSAPDAGAVPTPASPALPEQAGTPTATANGRGEAATGDVDRTGAASEEGAEQPSRRGRLGLFRRTRSRGAEEGRNEPAASEPLPAQDEEYVDWVAGLSKPVADSEPEQGGPRSLRSTGRHHRD